MKKISSIFLGLTLFASLCFGADEKSKMAYQAVPMNKATIVQEGLEKNYCPLCGMTLPMFYKTNHTAKQKGVDKQYCSIHCMVEDVEVNGAKLSDMRVVDNKSLKFVGVKEATYVVGSSKPGTMSMVSKYAFLDKADAKAFQKENGGEIKTFDEVYALVKANLEKEMAAVSKKQAKMAKMGEKIYTKMCKATDKTFATTAKAKAYLVQSGICGQMKGKKLQAVGIYLSRR